MNDDAPTDGRILGVGWSSPGPPRSTLWLIPLVVATLFGGLWYENHSSGGDPLKVVAARSRPVSATSHGVHIAASVMRRPYTARVVQTAEHERVRVGGDVPAAYVVFHITNPTKTTTASLWDVSIHIVGRGWMPPTSMGVYFSQLTGSHEGPPYIEQPPPGAFRGEIGPRDTGDIIMIIPTDGPSHLIFTGQASPTARIDKVRFRVDASVRPTG